MIRELTVQEMEGIYHGHMTHDFPEAELKPIALISRLMEEGRYRVFGSYEGEKLRAYALLIHEKDSQAYLLDFFAVCRDGRGKGTGSAFLKGLFQTLKPEVLILEVENTETAIDGEDRRMRCRRMDFYHRNGVRDTGLVTVQFGVNLVVMYLAEDSVGDHRIYERLDQIYRFTFGEQYGNGTVTLDKR